MATTKKTKNWQAGPDDDAPIGGEVYRFNPLEIGRDDGDSQRSAATSDEVGALLERGLTIPANAPPSYDDLPVFVNPGYLHPDGTVRPDPYYYEGANPLAAHDEVELVAEPEYLNNPEILADAPPSYDDLPVFVNPGYVHPDGTVRPDPYYYEGANPLAAYDEVGALLERGYLNVPESSALATSGEGSCYGCLGGDLALDDSAYRGNAIAPAPPEEDPLAFGGSASILG